jgi:hypothetical protein
MIRHRRIALLTGASLPTIAAAGEPCNTPEFGLSFILADRRVVGGDGPFAGTEIVTDPTLPPGAVRIDDETWILHDDPMWSR